VVSVSTFSDEPLSLAGLDAAAEGPEVAPREEPYLEPHRLDKPALDVDDGVDGDHDFWLLVNPESGHQWAHAHQSAFVDVEAQR